MHRNNNKLIYGVKGYRFEITEQEFTALAATHAAFQDILLKIGYEITDHDFVSRIDYLLRSSAKAFVKKFMQVEDYSAEKNKVISYLLREKNNMVVDIDRDTNFHAEKIFNELRIYVYSLVKSLATSPTYQRTKNDHEHDVNKNFKNKLTQYHKIEQDVQQANKNSCVNNVQMSTNIHHNLFNTLTHKYKIDWKKPLIAPPLLNRSYK